METRDVIVALLAAGWRYEYVAGATLPCLTNTPSGQEYCVAGGHFVSLPMINQTNQVCYGCGRKRYGVE